MTINLERRSPVTLKGRPIKTENRDGWHIVSEYSGVGKGPHIVDLSHFARWDIQDRNLGQVQPYGDMIPGKPGQIFMHNNLLVGRLNATQAVAWHFSEPATSMPQAQAFTDITDAAVALALIGPAVFDMAEKLCALDLADPSKNPPFLVQGPFSHVPCHLWVLDRTDSGGCMALTCSRGYAHDMVNSLLEAGAEWDIRPQGEDMFKKWLGW
jgi:hypothetical protein